MSSGLQLVLLGLMQRYQGLIYVNLPAASISRALDGVHGPLRNDIRLTAISTYKPTTSVPRLASISGSDIKTLVS